MLELLNNNQLGSRKISYEPILQFMLSYLGHPSLIASLLVVKFWSSALISKKIGTVVKDFKQFVTQIVATISAKLIMDKPTPAELGFIKYQHMDMHTPKITPWSRKIFPVLYQN